MTKKKTVILADDDAAIRFVLASALTNHGFNVKQADNAATMQELALAGDSDIIVTDVVMPDGNAFDFIAKINTLQPDIPIIVMSAQTTLMTAIKATQLGAYEYIAKPFDLDKLLYLVEAALNKRDNPPLTQQTKSMDHDSGDDKDKIKLIGRSPAMQNVYRAIARLTHNRLNVLITGASGTGKELVAKALHYYGPNADAPFVAVNMAAIPNELIESELFGHKKGAFTGAYQDKNGYFAQAKDGTIFFDEIGDMPLNAQTRLLRVLQEKEYQPIGSSSKMIVEARIIAATHRNLHEQVLEGNFREDLYYRLNAFSIHVPPLKNRIEDIDDLVDYFIEVNAKDNGITMAITNAAVETLKQYQWPGNIRQLANFISRLGALYGDDVIDYDRVRMELASIDAANSDIRSSANSSYEQLQNSLDVYINELCRDINTSNGDESHNIYSDLIALIEKRLIAKIMAKFDNNQLRAAKILGLNRNTLRRKITTYFNR